MMNSIADDLIHGENFQIGKFCIIEEECVFGDNVTIENYSHIRRGVKIGNNSSIGNYCEIGEKNIVKENVIIQGRIRSAQECVFENNVTVKYGTILTSKVLLKEGCFLGPNVITLGSTHKRETIHGTIIGEHSYIGAGSKILGGIHIGDSIAIGALSLVNKNIDEPGVYAGIPLRFIKNHD